MTQTVNARTLEREETESSRHIIREYTGLVLRRVRGGKEQFYALDGWSDNLRDAYLTNLDCETPEFIMRLAREDGHIKRGYRHEWYRVVQVIEEDICWIRVGVSRRA